MSNTPELPSKELAVIETSIVELRKKADAIQVRTQADYVAACQIVLDGRSYVKDVKGKLAAGIESAKKHLDFLKNEVIRYTAPVDDLIKIAEKKAEDWRAEEKRLADIETARINNERLREQQKKADDDRAAAKKLADDKRKSEVARINADLDSGKIGKREAARQLKAAGAELEAAKANADAVAEEAKNAPPPPPVKAEAAVPKVAGIKGRTNWKFRIVDETKVPRLYCKPDEVSIGNMVRSVKDKAKAEAMIAGIEVYSEESI